MYVVWGCYFIIAICLMNQQLKLIFCIYSLKQHDCLIMYGFTSRSIIFHLDGDVTIACEGLQNLGLCSGPLSRERSLSCHTCCDTGPRVFFGLIRRTTPTSRLLRHTWRCGESILTRGLKQQPNN
jgi:hypothetical protein